MRRASCTPATLRRRACAWSCALVVASIPAAPAAWARGGAANPVVDPQSPAGTEYRLPLERAREQAAGGGGASRPNGAAALFGAGVRPGRPGSGGRPLRGAAGDGRSTTVGGQTGTRGGAAGTKVAAPSVSAGGGIAIASIGAGALAVLLVGGLAGLVWRRRTMRR